MALRELDLNSQCPDINFFFFFLEESKILKRREGNRSTGACLPYYLSFVFLFSFLSFSFFLAFLLSFYCIFPFMFFPCFFRPLFWAQWRSFYSACHDQILLFCPLTTFVWSRYTCRPPLVCLHHPPQLQTKKNCFIYWSTVVPFPTMV